MLEVLRICSGSKGAALVIYLKYYPASGERKGGSGGVYEEHVPLIFGASQVAPITPVLVSLHRGADMVHFTGGDLNSLD